MEFENFDKIRGFRVFRQDPCGMLQDTLNRFVSATVEVVAKPINEFRDKYGIDITANYQRNVYVIDCQNILLVCNVEFENVLYLLGINIQKRNVKAEEGVKLYNVLGSTLSAVLTEAVIKRFNNSFVLFNENLITYTIIRFASCRYYNRFKMQYLIEYFNALRTTTFEGKYFSSGIIVTKSLYKYKDKNKHVATGLVKLQTDNNLTGDINARYWYLADGYSTFYLTDLKSDKIHYMYVRGDEELGFIENMLLKDSRHRMDVVLRTDNGRELSVITTYGIEFIYQENTWRYRNYNWLKKIVLDKIKLKEDVYNSVIYYVLYCSKHDTSSIIWIPAEIEDCTNQLSNYNVIKESGVNVTNMHCSGLMKRFLSSDGATIIAPDGTVKYYGCIIKMNPHRQKGLKGTGETAAAQLASNGIAFKISQDGIIKIFLDEGTVIKF